MEHSLDCWRLVLEPWICSAKRVALGKRHPLSMHKGARGPDLSAGAPGRAFRGDSLLGDRQWCGEGPAHGLKERR